MKNEEIFGYFNFDKFYSAVVSNFESGSIFVEIGVYLGKSICYLAEEIKKQNKDIKVYGIDIWGRYYPEYSIDPIYDVVKSNTEKYSDIITLIRGRSELIADYFEDESVDFVFLDGGHMYEQVKQDITKWLPKIKYGGLLAGHDMNKWHPGVIMAVNELLPKVIVTKTNGVWRYKNESFKN